MRGNTLKVVFIASALLVVAVAAIVYMARPTWEVNKVRDVVESSLFGEYATPYLVGGNVEILVSREIADQGRFSWIPGWLNRPFLFGAQARVEVWGNVQYGININDFNLEHISLAPDGAIEIELPPLQVTAVEPDLTRMTIMHSDGVFRPDAGRALRDSALADIDGAFRDQAAYHIDWSTTSAENVARALAGILTPAFELNGMKNPRFRFRLSENVFFDTGSMEPGERLELPNP